MKKLITILSLTIASLTQVQALELFALPKLSSSLASRTSALEIPQKKEDLQALSLADTTYKGAHVSMSEEDRTKLASYLAQLPESADVSYKILGQSSSSSSKSHQEWKNGKLKKDQSSSSQNARYTLMLLSQDTTQANPIITLNLKK